MEKLLKMAVNFKILMLMYFAGFTFVYLFLDLVWWKTGVLSTIIVWQILGMAVVLSITQYLIYEHNILHTDNKKKQIAAHFVVNYVLLPVIAWLFGWSYSISVSGIAIYTLIFIVAFAGLHIGFDIYYKVMGNRMNIQLEKYKKQ